MSPEVLVDTSVWVDFYRGGRSTFMDQLEGLVKRDAVSICGVIAAELLQGTRDEAEYHRVSGNLLGLHYLEMDQALFLEAARRSYELRRRGVTVALTDVLIATAAIRHRQKLWTRDLDFKQFKDLSLTLLP